MAGLVCFLGRVGVHALLPSDIENFWTSVSLEEISDARGESSARPRTLGPTAASTAEADRAALHTTASGVPNEHVSRLRQ